MTCLQYAVMLHLSEKNIYKYKLAAECSKDDVRRKNTLYSRYKAVLLLWIFYVFVLSCVCYVFVRICLYVLCGHLLGKG